ncbi:MAG TPA: hypothetical protein VK466_14225 [Terriglobales bacterium]|nr:hypothetical protein [Terriglobales bacterium]
MLARKPVWSFLLVVLLLTATTGTGWAKGCSARTLKGTYVAFEQGQFVTDVPGLFPLGPFVNTAKATFDGEGNFSGEYVAVIGDGTVRQGEFSGTYTVGSDCTYSDDFTVTIPGIPFPVPLHHKGFISGESILQEVHYIYVDPSSAVPGVLSGTLKKQ